MVGFEGWYLTDIMIKCRKLSGDSELVNVQIAPVTCKIIPSLPRKERACSEAYIGLRQHVSPARSLELFPSVETISGCSV